MMSSFSPGEDKQTFLQCGKIFMSWMYRMSDQKNPNRGGETQRVKYNVTFS